MCKFFRLWNSIEKLVIIKTLIFGILEESQYKLKEFNIMFFQSSFAKLYNIKEQAEILGGSPLSYRTLLIVASLTVVVTLVILLKFRKRKKV